MLAELELFGGTGNAQCSWVALTADEKGRLIAGDQTGDLLSGYTGGGEVSTVERVINWNK